ncbi:MAG TPA: hypothetical protein VIU87_14495, partial [Mycobacterium sp.]
GAPPSAGQQVAGEVAAPVTPYRVEVVGLVWCCRTRSAERVVVPGPSLDLPCPEPHLLVSDVGDVCLWLVRRRRGCSIEVLPQQRVEQLMLGPVQCLRDAARLLRHGGHGPHREAMSVDAAAAIDASRRWSSW